MAAAGEMIPDFQPVIVDDSGEAVYASWVANTWPTITQVHHPERLGLAGAVRSLWTLAVSHDDPFVFLLEDDFLLTQSLEVDAMVRTMRANPRLAQLVLSRQPWGDEEKAHGMPMVAQIERFFQRDGWVEQIDGQIYSFNPHIARRESMKVALEHAGGFLEADVTAALVERGWTFGIWGARTDGPRCLHIGDEHSAGYRW